MYIVVKIILSILLASSIFYTQVAFFLNFLIGLDKLVCELNALTWLELGISTRHYYYSTRNFHQATFTKHLFFLMEIMQLLITHLLVNTSAYQGNNLVTTKLNLKATISSL